MTMYKEKKKIKKENVIMMILFICTRTVILSTCILIQTTVIQNLTLLWLYHTILTFNDPREEGFGRHCGKRRKCW